MENKYDRHGKKVGDLGFAAFIQIIEAKCMEYGKVFHRIYKWYPSSKTCFECDAVNRDLHKWEHKWTCPACGAFLLRDPNASRNIRRKGIEELDAIRIKVGASTCSQGNVSDSVSCPVTV